MYKMNFAGLGWNASKTGKLLITGIFDGRGFYFVFGGLILNGRFQVKIHNDPHHPHPSQYQGHPSASA
jgi:hypothetical protein